MATQQDTDTAAQRPSVCGDMPRVDELDRPDGKKFVAELQQGADGILFVLANAHEHGRDLDSLLNMLDLDDDKNPVTFKLAGELYSLPRLPLKHSLSDFGRLRELTDGDSRVRVADVQQTLHIWAQENNVYAPVVLQTFKRYLCYGLFNSRAFKTGGNAGSYDFSFQCACLAFACAVKHAGFECLVLAKMQRHIRKSTPIGIANTGRLFVLAPVADSRLAEIRSVAIQNPGSPLHKDHVFCTKVFQVDEWKALDLRLQGRDSPSPLALKLRSRADDDSDARALTQSRSATTLSKLIAEAKKEAALTGGNGPATTNGAANGHVDSPPANKAAAPHAKPVAARMERADLCKGLGADQQEDASGDKENEVRELGSKDHGRGTKRTLSAGP